MQKKEKQMSEEKRSEVLDRLVGKLISRKFLVWLTATGLMIGAGLSSDDWVIISAIYVGGQTVIDGIARLKGVQ